MSREISVILVNCWKFKVSWKDFYSEYPVMDCLGLGYIASALRYEGYEVTIIDAFIEHLYPCQIASRIAGKTRGKTFLLGFSSMSPDQVEHAIRIVERLRRQGIEPLHTTIGGVFATASHCTILEHFSEIFDSVVCGEGEETVKELLHSLASDKEWTGIPGLAVMKEGLPALRMRRAPVDLDSLPFPSRDSLDRILDRGGEPQILTSRGCSSNCLFCMDRQHYSYLPSKIRWHCRSPKSVVDEIEWLVWEKGARRIGVADENAIGSLEHKSRLMEIGDEIIRRRLRFRFYLYLRSQDIDLELLEHLQKAGLSSIFVGLESFWQPTLDRFNKGITVEQNVLALRNICRAEGLRLYFGIMMYHPWVTLEEIVHNLKMIQLEILKIPLTGLQLPYRVIQVLSVYKSTPLYYLAKRDGLLSSESGYDGWLCSYSLPVEIHKHLALLHQELRELIPLQLELEAGYRFLQEAGDSRGLSTIQDLSLQIGAFIIDTSLRFAEAISAGSRRKLREAKNATRAARKTLIEHISQVRLKIELPETRLLNSRQNRV